MTAIFFLLLSPNFQQPLLFIHKSLSVSIVNLKGAKPSTNVLPESRPFHNNYKLALVSIVDCLLSMLVIVLK